MYICFPTSKEDKNKASCTNGGIGNYFYIHIKPSVATTQLSSVVDLHRMIAIAFLMVNTQPPKNEYHKGYHGTTLKNTSYYRTPVTAPIAFFVMRCKKSLKLLPERF
jgi:hypothetical protein